MRTELAWGVVATTLALGACGGGAQAPAAATPEGIALVTVRPTQSASLVESRMPECGWCTSAFGAELAVTSTETLTGVNLWLDGWSGNRRCLYSQHASPADGFTLPAGEPVIVSFRHAAVECAAPFSVDRIDVRARAGDTLVYQGSFIVRLEFRE
jgi:hypothetical protein